MTDEADVGSSAPTTLGVDEFRSSRLQLPVSFLAEVVEPSVSVFLKPGQASSGLHAPFLSV